MTATLATKEAPESAESGIRALIEHWAAAIRSADVDRIMAFYADDVIAYDAIAQLQFVGKPAYRDHWAFCMSMCGGMIFDPGDITASADGDVGFAHCLIRCGGVGPDGQEQANWMRMTAGYRRAAGHWKIAHEHFSAPFDMESGKALFELTP